MIKINRLFTPVLLRILYVIFVLLLMGMACLIPGIGSIFALSAYCVIALFCDTYIFGGIAGKEQHKMNFVRSSLRGNGLIRRALKVNLTYHNIAIWAIGVVSYVISLLLLTDGFSLWELGFAVASSSYSTGIFSLTLWLSRKFVGGIQGSIFAAYGEAVVLAAGLALQRYVFSIEEFGIVKVLCLLPAIALAVFGSAFCLKKSFAGFITGFYDNNSLEM